jgi:AcrR family transcriptional regulator
MSPRLKSPVIEEFRLQSIREAATRVIARKGFEGATMQDIADEAQIAKGTLYLYFKDRDHLVESVAQHVLDDLHLALDAAFDVKAPFREKLRHVVETQFRFFDANLELFRVLHETVERSRGDVRRNRECDARYQAYLDQLTSLLRKAMTKGEIRSSDPERLAVFIAEGTVALSVRKIRGPKPATLESDVDLVVETLLRGLEPERRRD